MAKQNGEVAQRDAYLEDITAEVQEIDEQIKAASKPLFEKKEKLLAAKRHYQSFLKKKSGS